MKKEPAPPGKGQRSITSFIFKSSSKQNENPPPSEAGQPNEDDSQPSTSHIKTVDLTREEPPAKRARPAPAAVPISTAPAPAADLEARHARWQSKLVGDEGAGMQRVCTQDGVQSRQEKQKLTPLEMQVTELQRKHPDCLLAFEVGYKYRFFGGDAEIASQVLGIFSYPDRNFLTASVPTPRIDYHVRRLVTAGHKVGIIRQTETAAIKKTGQNRNQPFERKLTAMYTRATLEAGELAALTQARSASRGGEDEEGEDVDEGGAGGAPAAASAAVQEAAARTDGAAYSNEHRSAYLVCIVEEPVEGGSGGGGGGGGGAVDAAIVAVETSTGQVLYSQVRDSSMRAELESRLMFAAPSDLLAVEPLSAPTWRLLENYASETAGVCKEGVDGACYKLGGALAALTGALNPNSIGDGSNNASRHSPETTQKPSALDAVMLLPPLVLRALAHALDYLKPFGLEGVLKWGSSFREFSEVQELALSPNTLQQLEVLRNSDDGKERGSLLWLMDRTLSAAGARMMRRWVSRPLRNVDAIEERLDAVEELINEGSSHEVLSRLPGVLRTLPDIERSLGRILHCTSTPSELLAVLRTFKDLHMRLGMAADLDAPSAASSPPPLAPSGVSSVLLERVLNATADLQCAAAARDTLASINEDAAAANDKLRLFVDDERFPDVAAKRADATAAEAALEALRPELAKAVDVRSVQYVSLQNQGDYLVELPVELEKRAPKSWARISSTKKAVRFRPPQVKAELSTLELAKEHLALAAGAAWKQIQQEFSKHYLAFRQAVQALASLDCLSSFASLAASSGGYCRPIFCKDDEEPRLQVVAGRHPVLDVLLEGSFVPNDTRLESSKERCAVITGPNMGGKSCYIRQTALLAIMAQAGCFVPAESCTLHAFDAVFTRMGAADNIALGRSTFLEELSEASTILSRATPRSLVIIDELGRGTSTHDGMAVAQATLEYIVGSIKCLTLFVTHYPEVARLQGQLGGAVGSYFMSHVVEDEGEGAEERVDHVPKVTFLYKVTPGVAAASYGINVARMAGLPDKVIRRAAAKAAAIAGGEDAGVDKLVTEVRQGLEAVVSGSAEEAAIVVFELQERVRSQLQGR